MNIFIWDYKGAYRDSFYKIIQDMIQLHKVNIMALLETITSNNSANEIVKKIRMHKCVRMEAISCTSGIWVIWNANYTTIKMIVAYHQFTLLKVEDNRHTNWSVTIIYASFQRLIHNGCWRNLYNIAFIVELPWIIVGKFNAYLFVEEKKGVVIMILIILTLSNSV